MKKLFSYLGLQNSSKEKEFDGIENLSFNINKQTLINELSFIVLDTETSGLDKNAQLISLGLVELKNGEIEINKSMSQFYTWETSNGTSSIHGELSREISAEKEKEQLRELLFRIGNKPIVGHHIHFDISVLNKKIRTFFPNNKIKNQLLDTNDLWNRINNSSESNSLDELCAKKGIIIENRHTALGDAYLTALVFMNILQKLKKRGVLCSRDLFKKRSGLL